MTNDRTYFRRPGAGRQGGFSLVEVTVALMVLAIGLGGLSAAVVSSLRVGDTNEGVAVAHERARQIAAGLKETPFERIFVSFNEDRGDDPGGVGTAPGAAFDVPGLTPRTGDADGRVGSLIFPTLDGAPGALREDVVDVRLGMPRDVDGDGEVDGADHSDDYLVLPVLVRVEWTGPAGDASYELPLLLAR